MPNATFPYADFLLGIPVAVLILVIVMVVVMFAYAEIRRRIDNRK